MSKATSSITTIYHQKIYCEKIYLNTTHYHFYNECGWIKMSENNRDMVWVFVFLIVLISVLSVTMWGLGGGYMSGMIGMMGYGWGSMVLIPIAFLVLIAIGAYYLVTGSAGTSRSASNRSESALEMLKKRYAKGEITREQFLTMRKELES